MSHKRRYMKRDQSLQTRLIILWRVCKVGVRNLFRNAWLTIAAIAVMLVALTIMLGAVVLNVTARDVIGHLSQNLKVSIYLHDGADQQQVNELRTALEQNDYVSDVEYVSKDTALQRFMESFEDDEQLQAGLALAGGDTLPASFEVSTTQLARMPDIEHIAQEERFDDTVESITLGKTDARRTIDRAASIQNFVTTSSIIAASVFTVVSVLIIFNTIRMALFTRSEEIRIMKLIGATSGYIRGPFLVEASLYGVIAGVIAATGIYTAILTVGVRVAEQAEFAKTYEFFAQTHVGIIVFAGTILAGIIVGLFSSMLALHRYLKMRDW